MFLLTVTQRSRRDQDLVQSQDPAAGRSERCDRPVVLVDDDVLAGPVSPVVVICPATTARTGLPL